MSSRDQQVVVFLSAPPEQARGELEAIVRDHAESRVTVYVRDSHRHEYEDLLAECFVHSDKPKGSKRAFIRELRGHLYDEAIALDFGQWSFFPSRILFFLARSQVKSVRTERGVFEFSLLKPITLLGHLLYRIKHRSGAVGGMPQGTPFPFLFALYRKTFGLLFGVAWCTLEYGWRRVTR